jgi:pilus assembly protein CpaF
MQQRHVIATEARPPSIEGMGEVSQRELVRNALRMRPDRIIVGECRGGEALDMLQAMNTGHDGSMTTGHANSPRDLLSRLEVMVLMAGMDLPVRAIREQISSAVDIIVQQTRFSDGRRRVTAIVEVDGMEGEVILTQPLFAFKQRGVTASGEIVGDYTGFGQAPRFYEDLNEAGVQLDRSIFDTCSVRR